MSYGFSIRVPCSFATAVERTRAALNEQCFGVLFEIDVRATMWEKLHVRMEDYLILGTCNPPLARQALDADHDIGLLMPYHVVVRACGGDFTLVQAIDPQLMISLTDRAGLKPVADETAVRLRAALHALESDPITAGHAE
jgi:uncharacterized protein (DUF302 family)